MNNHIHAPTLLGIAGAGLMGRGIAQIAAQNGISVILYDSRAGGAREAKDAIIAVLETLSAKGKLTVGAVAAAAARLTVADSLTDLSACPVVVEAIVEKLEIKRELFQQLEAVVDAKCILATNTSSLSVTAIAATCQHPGRVAGFHFFSPVPLMKIVEVITGPLTDNGIAETLIALTRRMGHTPVRASDTPGFIVNHAGRGYLTESLRLLGETIAPYPDIDRVLRLGAGFRMGPFELLDLTGLDVSQPVMESIYDQYYQEPRFRPSPIVRQRLAAGLLGRKTQRGFYSYSNGQKQDLPPCPVPPRNDLPVWLAPAEAEAFPAVAELLRSAGAPLDTGACAGEKSLCLLLPIGMDVSTAAVAAG
ncbi:MAG: 3-hydroxyacyl-CoA dehydrogenase, partial [Zoogloeaceae bacterium]|nr:3-hydroxyacyl-CoA dehydrogenase [Zoogloeaceae bacterium]